jgi:hypothetical protein
VDGLELSLDMPGTKGFFPCWTDMFPLSEEEEDVLCPLVGIRLAMLYADG